MITPTAIDGPMERTLCPTVTVYLLLLMAGTEGEEFRKMAQTSINCVMRHL